MLAPCFRLLSTIGVLALPGLVACSDSSAGPVNTAPVAVVQPVLTAVRGDTVLLDGTASTDAEGDSLSFAWTIVSKPGGSTAEMLSSEGVSPAFVADMVGSYEVSLIVNDGHRSSIPDQATITATIPAPDVTIDSPADLAIVNSSPVTVTGSVTDATAVTLNGVPATMDTSAGTYTASLSLTSGSNPITVEASNATGVGRAQITVILNTAQTPVLRILNPKSDFLVGRAYLDTETPHPEAVTVRGVIQVYTTESANTPSVTVHGVPATVADTSYSGCPSGRCFKFNVPLSLARGRYTIWAMGEDVLTGKDSTSVTGISDYAYRPSAQQWTDENKTISPVAWTSFPNLPSLRQPPANPLTQNVRSQEIDGCSAPTGEAHRNDPMAGATQNLAPTAFGAGTQPPGEFLVYGQSSAAPLPCNKHDICYQTVGSSRTTCDDDFNAAMRAVCNKAYPPQTASYLLLHPVYKAEQNKCYNKAATYYAAVRAAGQSKFNARQAQHTYPRPQ